MVKGRCHVCNTMFEKSDAEAKKDIDKFGLIACTNCGSHATICHRYDDKTGKQIKVTIDPKTGESKEVLVNG